MGEQGFIRRNAGLAALIVSIITFVVSVTGLADAARHALIARIDGHRISSKPYADGLLVLGENRKFPASAIPTVKNSDELAGRTLGTLEPTCLPDTVSIGTWCLESTPYPLTTAQIGQNDYFFATQTCEAAGGWLPSAGELIGAAKRVKLESTINDSPLTSTVDQDPTVGLKDQREMSSTLVTTAAGADAAGSEGVSEGATGDPRTGEPNPVPLPANSAPSTLQYVTVYSDKTKGGFAGSEPVSTPENFRCAYDKAPGAIDHGE